MSTYVLYKTSTLDLNLSELVLSMCEFLLVRERAKYYVGLHPPIFRAVRCLNLLQFYIFILYMLNGIDSPAETQYILLKRTKNT